MSNPELQALLANLRPRYQGQTSSTTQPGAHGTANGNGNAPGVTAQNLLSLLNFNHTPQAQSEAVKSPNLANSSVSTAKPEPSFTAADLLARAAHSARASPAPSSSTVRPSTPQASIQNEPTSTKSPPAPTASQDISKGIFTYKNPFEALRASRPQTSRAVSNQTIPQETATNGTKKEEVVEDQETRTPVDKHSLTPFTTRSKLTPKTRRSRSSTPVPESRAEAVPPTEPTSDDPPSYSEAPVDVPETKPAPIMSEMSGVVMTDTGGGQDLKKGSTRVVPVLSFPVKAFVSIALHLKDPATSRVREESVMEISRLKKEFDQIDRSLTVASPKFIVYALVKNGGMRIIRQEDGKDRHIFKSTKDRVFNVSLCSTSMTHPPLDQQTLLGTGVSGSVYYTTLTKTGQDFFNDDMLDTESLIFPAYPPGDDNSLGGALKTRAKRSSRHPQFFAIGRGKSINIIWPSTVMSSRYGINSTEKQVDMEKFLKERALQIMTGKAGKDFNFSEDDTVIVSLDKTGRLRFWDIRKLIDEENARSMQIVPYIIDTPLLSLQTSTGTEKSWPTSVLFLDKSRPYMRGGALRYVLVGLRQNHTLQLWDIALGKAVQEINFPHENETDAICSVAYHASSGIIVVGHPTRNSIFFIHLSAPRYVLSSALSQASYVQRLAAKDTDLPKPESTACMSGLREISFEPRGQLRSVELLPIYKTNTEESKDTGEPLFELYVAHATGVTCLAISKSDLGWDADNKIVNNVNAETQGLVSIKELRLGSVIEETARQSPVPVSEPVPSQSAGKKKKKDKKKDIEEVINGVPESEPVAAAVEPQPEIAVESIDQPVVKESKKEKKKKKEAESASQDQSHKTDSTVPVDKPSTDQRTISPVKASEQMSMSISGDWLDKELKKIEKGVSTEFKRELDTLYDNIKTDRASQDQASSSRQAAVLQIVSDTLNKNVETTLSKILRKQMEDIVVPSVVNSISTTISQQITQTVTATVKKEISSELAVQVDRSLQSTQMLTKIADTVATRLATSVQNEINKSINSTISASMKSIATNTASEVIAAAEVRMSGQIAQMQKQHASFNEKIEQLNGALQSVATTLQSMSQAQVAFQDQVLQDRRAATQAQSTSDRQASSSIDSPSSAVEAIPAVPQAKTQADLEIDEISMLMESQRYEEGSIKWLQSSEPGRLFDDLFSRYTPDYLRTDVSPLVAFSIGVTVANSLTTKIKQRLDWIDVSFDLIDFKVSS